METRHGISQPPPMTIQSLQALKQPKKDIITLERLQERFDRPLMDVVRMLHVKVPLQPQRSDVSHPYLIIRLANSMSA